MQWAGYGLVLLGRRPLVTVIVLSGDARCFASLAARRSAG
jgi:hypothetical protein